MFSSVNWFIALIFHIQYFKSAMHENFNQRKKNIQLEKLALFQDLKQ